MGSFVMILRDQIVHFASRGEAEMRQVSRGEKGLRTLLPEGASTGRTERRKSSDPFFRILLKQVAFDSTVMIPRRAAAEYPAA